MDSGTTRKFSEAELRFLNRELALGEPIPYDDPLFELVDVYDGHFGSELEGRIRATLAKLVLDGIR